MLKKYWPLSWFDKHIQTKEDFQYIIVALLLALVIFIKCYMVFHSQENTTAEVQNPKTVLKQQAVN